MSYYVRVLTSFYTHRKTLRLRHTLGNDAFWIPPRLWAYAASNQPDGIFLDYSAQEIADLIDYRGDAPSMLQALLQTGFMDSDPLRIHDWEEHNLFLVVFERRARAAAKVRWEKEKERTKEREQSTVPYRTVPGQAVLKQCSSNAPSINRFKKPTIEQLKLQATKIGLPETECLKFLGHYEANGWRVGKNPMKSWPHALQNWKINFDEKRFQPNGSAKPSDIPLIDKIISQL